MVQTSASNLLKHLLKEERKEKAENAERIERLAKKQVGVAMTKEELQFERDGKRRTG